MKRFLLDTNHLADHLEPVSRIRRGVFEAIGRGDRIGTCILVLLTSDQDFNAVSSVELENWLSTAH